MAFQRKSLPINLKLGGAPIGAIIFFPGDLVNGNIWVTDDWLVCNGVALNKSTYSELFAIIGIKYGGTLDGNVFNIPNLVDGKYMRCATNVGYVHSAGLPDIRGYFTTFHQQSAWQSGACFSQSWSSNANSCAYTQVGGTNLPRYGLVGIFASKFNGIYGRYNDVIPYSVDMLPLIRVK